MQKTKSNICGKKIKVARIMKEMEQVELSAALSIDYNIDLAQTTISAIERGERSVKDYELLALAEVLDVTPESLLSKEDFTNIIEKLNKKNS